MKSRTMENRSYNDLGNWSSGDQNMEATAIAHKGEIDNIIQCIQQKQSILVVGKKILATYIIHHVEQNTKVELIHLGSNQENDDTPIGEHLSDQLGIKLSNLHKKLADGLDDADLENKVLVIKHLDLMLWTAENRPSSSFNDTIFWLSEYTGTIVLAFWDPVYQLPSMVENLFNNHISLQVFRRDTLWQLISKAEARKISDDKDYLTLAAQLRLYQYFSGSTAIEFRRIMSAIATLNFTSFEDTDKVFEEIQKQLPAKSANLSEPEMPKGYDQVETDLRDKVIFPVQLRHMAKDQDALKQADALIPKGVLFYGPSGNGKTEWAKWLSHELGATLIIIHGPEIKSKYLGDTEATIRTLFRKARRSAPSVILVDEIDAILPSRDFSQNNTDVSMVNQFLTEMNGLRQEEAVIVIGTTNREDAIDVAFKRAGRFDVSIEIEYPGEVARKAILEHYNNELKIGLGQEAINWISVHTDQKQGDFSGAHIKAICLQLLRMYLLESHRENGNPDQVLTDQKAWHQAIKNLNLTKKDDNDDDNGSYN